MSIEVVARNAKIHSSLQDYARAQADKLRADFPKIENVHVVLDFEGRVYRVQVVAQPRGAQVVGVGEHEENVQTAIDEAIEKVTRQMRKQRDKQVEARY